ncbi:lactate utilization protein C [Nocardioides marmoriginsengisoli]|uniref:Lactate utilization protein C n=1 Tax=Nocardioides marmoriginsengisoli TaxID=661483 RepID=A0A3N0CGU5_9ACTN|nr:LUD domain-containing protein [Nocardioides marmoriginsengisoli]RNL62539.1 lactate utilization protein C [Nocardioides marmoriginsengisoli]
MSPGESSGTNPARDAVLAAVRRALAGTDRAPRAARHRPAAGRPADVDLFVERVRDYRAEVVRCRPDEVAGSVGSALTGVAGVVVPEGLGFDVDGALVDDGLGARELDAIEGVVTLAAAAVAETGTIVLTHGPGQGRRALSLVPDLHVCVVAAEQVLADVPAAIEAVAGQPVTTWISGPSATSDIELIRVEGVHGPRRLVVVLVEPRS